MKKLIFFVLLTLFQLLANAETYNVVIDGIKYELTYINKDGSTYTNAEVIAYSYSGDIVIPVSVTYNGAEYNVTSIRSGAFHNCRTLTSITIPNSVTSIGCSAFEDCSSLISITIGNSVEKIGSYAFTGCSKLNAIHICDLATWCNIIFYDYELETGHYLYHYCDLPKGYRIYINNEEVKDLAIPNGITSIKRYAFSGCSSLTSVTIPNSVTSIEGNAFSGCSSLASITIPNSLTIIEGGAFGACSGLKKVIVPDIAAWCGVTIGSNPLSYAHHLYSDESTEIKDLVIPNSVTRIGNYAFSDCTGLISVTIPNSVTNIDNRAFSGCTGLNSITIPNSVTRIGSSTFEKCTGLTSITIPNSVTSIGNDAFSGCTGLTSVTTPNSVTSIGSKAFYHCTGLSQASIGSGSIGDNAFEDCNSLTSLTIGNGVKSIGQSAFKSCSRLTSVTMGNSINFISANAFASCPELIDVYCYAVNVPTTSSTVFKDSYIEYATLHVPDVSVNLYKQATPWNTFKEILAIEGGDPTIIVLPIRSADRQKAIYNLNGIKTKGNKIANSIHIRDGKKYFIK